MKVTIDNNEIQVEDGQVLIDVADSVDIAVPRFCYHKKLSVAANCRMCLVEVEGLRKVVPACATAVYDGMVVHTKSQKVKDSQKSVMEFLLINHPLDCPICDQGGECELQDVSMDFGKDISRFTEQKRVVPRKDIGSLIHTDLTRCIYCTRCVRFGQELAGISELGMCGRGEHAEISAFLEKSVESELSGNMIDVCPVGALTSKPFRYSARAWEMQSRQTIASHDSTGSNISYHIKNDKIKRAVPFENIDINDVWLSDRDRFSYEGFNHENRLLKPKMKINNYWQEYEWEQVLPIIVKDLKQAGSDLATVISPNCTLEEMYLAQSITRALGSNHIDHRIHQQDFSKQNDWAISPHSQVDLNVIENSSCLLVIGSNICVEHPMIAYRMRLSTSKLVVKETNENNKPNSWSYPVDQLNVKAFNFRMPTQDYCRNSLNWVGFLNGIIKCVLKLNKDFQQIRELDLDSVDYDSTHKKLAKRYIEQDKPLFILGNLATESRELDKLIGCVKLLATLVDGKWLWIPPFANSVGAWLSGCVPHRTVAGKEVSEVGKTITEMKNNNAVLSIGLELGVDVIASGDCVIALTTHETDNLLEKADILLPIASSPETTGTFVNFFGKWQSFNAVVNPPGDSKSTWKILRVLANMLELPDFDFMSAAEVQEKVKSFLSEKLTDWKHQNANPTAEQSQFKVVVVPQLSPFEGDMILRHAKALKETTLHKQSNYCYLHPETAAFLKLNTKSVFRITISKTEKIELNIKEDATIAPSVILIPKLIILKTEVTTLNKKITKKRYIDFQQAYSVEIGEVNLIDYCLN